ncbi:MAG: PAS domain-containing protein [Alphaproteobacteria bacterium]|nr:MAG: PAS domain-containing protein [Alphaproteobacteria bacterium]
MLQQQQFDEMLAYWRALQQEEGGQVPRRRRFNPMRVARLLPYVFIVEQRQEMDLHVRIAGTAIEAVMGRSITGLNYLDLYDQSQWGFFADVTSALCGQPCGARLHREVTFNNGRQFDMHSLNLPLASDDGDVKYILGLMAMRRSSHTQDIGGDSKVKMFTVRDIDLIDLGFGVPAADAVKARLQRASA